MMNEELRIVESLRSMGNKKTDRIPYFRTIGTGGNGIEVFYWFPNPFCAPQSGQSQVIPLQEMPQKFSSMQSWHMVKPHRQRQQNGAAVPQQ